MSRDARCGAPHRSARSMPVAPILSSPRRPGPEMPICSTWPFADAEPVTAATAIMTPRAIRFMNSLYTSSGGPGFRSFARRRFPDAIRGVVFDEVGQAAREVHSAAFILVLEVAVHVD